MSMYQSPSNGLTRDGGGTNWDGLLLDSRAPESYVEKNVWTASMNEYPGQKEDFEQQAKALFNLDLKQMDFTRHFLQNDTGVSVLFGPAGSGKTYTVVATLLLYLATNKKYREGLDNLGNRHRVLVTATTEAALDAILRKCVLRNCVEQSLTLDCQKFVRFNGGNRHTHPSAARKADVMTLKLVPLSLRLISARASMTTSLLPGSHFLIQSPLREKKRERVESEAGASRSSVLVGKSSSEEEGYV